MASTDKTNDDKRSNEDKRTDEERSREAMGKSPAGTPSGDSGNGNDSPGNASVAAAGGDPDSIQRVVKHLPDDLRERSGLGASDPEELSAQRTAYAEEVAAQRSGRPGRAELKGMSDEEKAAATGQPLGDGKAEGAPSADDPDSPEREAAAAGQARSAAGQSKLTAPQGRSASAPTKATTAPKGQNSTEGK
jgi:hypothetical protein